jgi:DNA-directed RNA polymerase specialized sigma24 family protein
MFGVSLESLSRRTRMPGVETRTVFCHLAVHEGECSGREIARMLGMSRAGVSIAASRGEMVLQERPELRDVLLD